MKPLLILTLLAFLAAAPGHARAAGRARTAPARAASKPHAAAPARASENAGNRTLEDIHIEGEIPVPQVLFITARDQRRFLEFQHRNYLRTSSQLSAATAVPRWIVVTSPQGKEIPR